MACEIEMRKFSFHSFLIHNFALASSKEKKNKISDGVSLTSFALILKVADAKNGTDGISKMT